MPVPAVPLVGRDDEVTALDRVLARVRGGQSAVVAVLGEPGIGKTRLLQELASRARIGEVAVTGSASEYGGTLPYGAFVAALDDYIRTIDPRLLGALDDEQHTTLAELLPSYPVTPPRTAALAPVAPFQAHRAMRALLQTLASTKPHLVVLDDLHWADSATLALVGSLLRRPPTGPVLLLLAARVRQAPATFLAAVDDAVRCGIGHRVELRPLTSAQSRRLLDPHLHEDDVRQLLAVAQGNPFYLQQLTRIPSPGRASVRANASSPHRDLPPSVAAALTEEVEGLDVTARQLLQGAAVVGDPFEADLAARAAGLSDQAAARAIDDLLDRDMIRHAEVPRRFQFRHPLLCRAVYEKTPGGWQLAAHERCAQELEARGASPVLLAAHLEHAGRHGDDHAIDTLANAGALLALRSPLDAARFLAAALRLTPATRIKRRVALGAGLARAFASAGRFAPAHRACRDTLALLDDEGSETFLELTSLCARLDQALGNHAEAHARLSDALARVKPDLTSRRIDLLSQLSVDAFYALDPEAMAAWGASARAEAAAHGDDVQRTHATSLLALGAVLAGKVDVALAAHADAARSVDTLPDDRLIQDPNLLGPLATSEYYLDLYPDAATHVERALRLARASGRGQYVPLLFWQGTIHTARGNLVHAMENFELAVDIARSTDFGVGVAWNLAPQSIILNWRGETERAREAASEALALTSTRSARLPAALARLAHATILIDAAEPQLALEQLGSCAAPGEPSRLPSRWQPQAYELTVRCQLALGNIPEARRAIRQLDCAADNTSLPTARAFAHRAVATIALATSAPEQARKHAMMSLESFEAVGAALDAERTRVLLGRAFEASGAADRAIRAISLAATRFEESSAHGLRAEADRELRRLGHRRHQVHAPPAQGENALDLLTPREREVAGLVADGKTNPQIAEELFVSQKTIESHIRSTFQKLHVKSRLELARTVDRALDEGA